MFLNKESLLSTLAYNINLFQSTLSQNPTDLKRAVIRCNMYSWLKQHIHHIQFIFRYQTHSDIQQHSHFIALVNTA